MKLKTLAMAIAVCALSVVWFAQSGSAPVLSRQNTEKQIASEGSPMPVCQPGHQCNDDLKTVGRFDMVALVEGPCLPYNFSKKCIQ